MYESFELPVTYNGQDMLFPARLLQHGYIHRFQVEIYGEMVLFERDDEGMYRALMSPEDAQKTKISKELIRVISEVIEELTT
jgi:hypothetical protein